MSRNVLARFGVPFVVALAVLAGACGGSGQEDLAVKEEAQDRQGQLFATDPFGLESGLAIVKMTHRGEGNFVANLISARQDETTTVPEPIEFSGDQNGGSRTEVSVALANERGPVSVSRAVNVPVAGKHLFDVKADGPWTIEVEQPRPSDAPEETRFSGADNTATPFFKLSSGVKTITIISHQEAFSPSLLEEDGAPTLLNEHGTLSLLNRYGNLAEVPVLDEGVGSDVSGATTRWATVDIPEEGIYLFNVGVDGLWSIDIAEGVQPSGLVRSEGIEFLGMPVSLVIGVLVVPVALGIVILLASRGSAGERPGKRSSTTRPLS